jgi:hypothetical protein
MRKSLEAISLIVLAVLIWITWQALNGSSPLPDRIPPTSTPPATPTAGVRLLRYGFCRL